MERGLTSRPLTLLHVFPTFAVGGAQTRFAALANHLGDAAHHIVVSLDGREEAREKLRAGLHVTFPAAPAQSGWLGDMRGALAFLRQADRDGGVDRLITSNWGSMDWAAANRVTGFAHVHTEDGFGPEERDRQLRRRAWARRVVLGRSEVVLPSRTLMRIAGEVWHLPRRRLHFIPNGIDTARYANAMPIEAARLAALGDGPVIGTIAVLRPEKQIARLLAAFARLRQTAPARLVIVGDGAERPALERQAAALGIAANVLFAGYSAEPERWMASFDIFALSSDTEQMPLSVLEAMAAGLPVVATDVGDVRAMVAPDNAALIVPRDADALAAALAQALAPGQGAGPANRARAQAEFDQAGMFARYRALLEVG